MKMHNILMKFEKIFAVLAIALLLLVSSASADVIDFGYGRGEFCYPEMNGQPYRQTTMPRPGAPQPTTVCPGRIARRSGGSIDAASNHSYREGLKLLRIGQSMRVTHANSNQPIHPPTHAFCYVGETLHKITLPGSLQNSYYCTGNADPEPDPEEPVVECVPGPGEIRVMHNVINLGLDAGVNNGQVELDHDVSNGVRISCVEGRRPNRENCYKYVDDNTALGVLLGWTEPDDAGCCNAGYRLSRGYPCRDGQLCPEKIPSPSLGYCAPGEEEDPTPVAQLAEGYAQGNDTEIPEECIRFSWLFIASEHDMRDNLPPIPIAIGATNPAEVIETYANFFLNKCVLAASIVNSLICSNIGFGPGSGKLDECLFIMAAYESCTLHNFADAASDVAHIKDPLENVIAFMGRFLTNMAVGTGVADAVEGDFQGFDHSFTAPACSAGSVAYDENCHLVEGDLDTADCDHVFIYGDLGTPVSLLWDGSERLSEEPVARMFELEPGNPQWIVWKASEKAPLLVHTPNGETEITSAKQLFGSSAFGKSFKNGYEALATLDADKNGSLEDKELVGISLWFDKNRDAVSQAGELRTVQEADVVSIFLSSDIDDPETGDMYASRGFSRKVDGKVETGVSVDWLTQGSAEKKEIEKLVKNEVAFNNFTETRERLLGERKPAPAAYPKKHLDMIAGILRELQERDAKTGFRPGPVAGSWNWKIAEKNIHPQFRDKISLAGAMLFVQTPDGRVVGYVDHESPAMDKIGRMQKVVTKLPVNGKVADKTGTSFTFTVDGPSDQGTTSKTVNTVKLGSDENTLNGASVTTHTYADGKTKEYRYNWTATRAKL